MLSREGGDCLWHAQPWHLKVTVVLSALGPAACWGCNALPTCMKQCLLDQESCDHLPVHFQSWKLAAGYSAGRKVTFIETEWFGLEGT